MFGPVRRRRSRRATAGTKPGDYGRTGEREVEAYATHAAPSRPLPDRLAAGLPNRPAAVGAAFENLVFAGQVVAGAVQTDAYIDAVWYHRFDVATADTQVWTD